MPQGDKSKYTDKQKRKARHIEEGYESRGVPPKEAAARAWATVNKEDGGGNKSGSGRGVPDTKVSSRKGGKLGGAAARPAAAKKAAATRKRAPAGDATDPANGATSVRRWRPTTTYVPRVPHRRAGRG
ncbi:MAG: plasmid stabilization protein [Gemmataceae bacterium]